jgi:hypothetical protein
MPWGTHLVIDGVVASKASTQLSFNAARMTFAIHNPKDVAETVAIAVDSDIRLETADSAPVMSVGSNRGFVVYTNVYALTFLTRDYPLAHDLSSYWFGGAGELTIHCLDQVECDNYFGDDSGFALSW